MANYLNFYQRWEGSIDAFSFAAPEVFSLLARQTPVLSPTGSGALFATICNATLIKLSKYALSANERHSRILQVSAVVMGLAMSIIVIPHLASYSFSCSVMQLTPQMVLDFAIGNCVMKVAVYALYRIGSALVGEPKGMSVLVQLALGGDLSKCVRIGTGWTDVDIKQLYQKDVTGLSFDLRKMINQLFFDHNFPPQNRAYETDEFPVLPADPLQQGLLSDQLKWVNLILPAGAKRDLGMTTPDNWMSHIRGYWNDYLGDHGNAAKIRKYHVILKEYHRILGERFDIDLQKTLAHLDTLKSKNPGNQLTSDLYRTVQILTFAQDPKQQKEYTDARTQRGLFVQKLRAVIRNDDYQKIRELDENLLTEDQKYVRFIVRSLSDVIFMPEIYNYVKGVTELFTEACMEMTGVDPKLEPTLTLENYATVIDRRNRQIRGAPNSLGKSKAALATQKLMGAIGYKDFIGSENTPHKRNEIQFESSKTQKPWKLDYCRHGCPVTPGTASGIVGGMLSRMASSLIRSDISVRSGESVAPEYVEMLAAMADRGEAALYCNHQRRYPGGVENERDRVEALENLEQSSPNFFLLSQPVEGNLFERKGDYHHIRTFEELKAALIASYDQEDQNEVYAEHRLPMVIRNHPGLRSEYLTEVLPNLLNQVHGILFDGKSLISFDGKDPVDKEQPYKLREWQLFIEAFYALQRLDLVFRLSSHETNQGAFKVTRLKTVCKDFLDRGGNEAQILDMMLYYMLNSNPPDEWFDETAYNLLGAPIIVKKKEAIPKRIKPGMSMAEHLSNLPTQKKEALLKLEFGGEWKPSAVQVAKRSDQEAMPFHILEVDCEPGS